MWRLARDDSFTVDESPHLAAGYAYLRHQTGRLNPEHPPLAKLLAALPVRDIQLPASLFERTDLTPQELQYEAGHQALQGDYGRSRRIVRRSRIAIILLTLALAFTAFGLGRWLYSRVTGLLAALFLLASPLVLAHGHYVTTDAGAALGCLAALWAFLAFLNRPSPAMFAAATAAFGLAQLMKFSALLLIPVLVVIAARHRRWRTLAVVPLGFALVVAPVYTAINTRYPSELQQRDTDEYLRDNTGLAARLTRTLASAELTRPLAQYTLGIALAQRRVSEPAHFYFQGRNRDQGTHWYFPLVYLWKEPLPAIAFVLGGLALAWRRTAVERYRIAVGHQSNAARLHSAQNRHAPGHHVAAHGATTAHEATTTHPLTDEHQAAERHTARRTTIEDQTTTPQRQTATTALWTFLALYTAAILTTALNLGARHLLPLYPIAFLLAAEGWRRLGNKGLIAAAALLTWNIAETAGAFPHLLSYANPIGGGTAHAYRQITDSNYDWGQDLERLRLWSLTHPGLIALDYLGGDDAGSALGGRVIGWWSARGDPRAAGARYLAVSIQQLQAAVHPAAYPRPRQDEYRWLIEMRPPSSHTTGEPPAPDYRAGTSIFIYDLTRLKHPVDQ